VQSRTLHNLQFEEKFWEIIHAGFGHKRKKLSSNLKKYLTYGGVASVEVMKKKKNLINNLGNKRAEELSLFDWINLVKNISSQK